MRHLILLAATGCSQILGVNDVTVSDAGSPNGDGGLAGSGEAPRLIAPLAMTTVTQQRPTLRWALGTTGGTPTIELCADRACTMPLATSAHVADGGLTAVPDANLPPGWVFWRACVAVGGHPACSATWQFWVGTSSAGNSIDTANGALLDVNGDGYPDVLVGANGANAGAGTAHLYLGSATVSADDWNASASAHRIDLAVPGDSAFGFAVASAGDVNGDGYADFIVGAFATASDRGVAHLYLGSATPDAGDWNAATSAHRIDLLGLDGSNAAFGSALAGAGDINGDGYADFVIGASKAGVVHAYFGSAAPSAADWNGATLTSRIDLASPEVFAAFGTSVAGVGDVDGDGYADFVVGASSASSAAGKAHLYFGSATPSASNWSQDATHVDLDDLDGATAAFGSAVSGVGDVNGDGYQDFAVGARGASTGTGAAHLYLGAAHPSTTEWNRASSTARIDVTSPDGASGLFSSTIAAAGDVNGDGYADFIVGAMNAGSGAGAAHLYLGAAALSAALWNGTAPTQRITLGPLDGASAQLGSAAVGVGDLNHDGYMDFAIGASNASAMAGASHVYLGGAVLGATTWTDASSPLRLDLTDPVGATAGFGGALACAWGNR